MMINLLSVAVFAGGFFGGSLFLPVLTVNSEALDVFSNQIQCWTEWFDRDDPSVTGDWETLPQLIAENPGKICSKPIDVQAQTVTGLSVAAAGDLNTKVGPTVGFICRNEDQRGKMCHDYRVRFSCRPPFCHELVCWTDWYNRDSPTGSGDYEFLSNLRKEHPGQICESPLFIEAVTSVTLTPAINTGQIFDVFNPTQGFACVNKVQKKKVCHNYKVRFGCPCKYTS